MKMNLGCGPDLKEGWLNVDGYVWPNAELWDATTEPPVQYLQKFDHVLINHTLCLLSFDDADRALKNVYECLEEFGVVEVIDMDLIKAFKSFEQGEEEDFAGQTGSIDEMLCKHLFGYGRKSVYTAQLMKEKLEKAGFKDVSIEEKSQHDLRPKESLIVRGRK